MSAKLSLVNVDLRSLVSSVCINVRIPSRRRYCREVSSLDRFSRLNVCVFFAGDVEIE